MGRSDVLFAPPDPLALSISASRDLAVSPCMSSYLEGGIVVKCVGVVSKGQSMVVFTCCRALGKHKLVAACIARHSFLATED